MSGAPVPDPSPERELPPKHPSERRRVFPERSAPACAECGFDLQGLPASGNCPECGVVYDPRGALRLGLPVGPRGFARSLGAPWIFLAVVIVTVVATIAIGATPGLDFRFISLLVCGLVPLGVLLLIALIAAGHRLVRVVNAVVDETLPARRARATPARVGFGLLRALGVLMITVGILGLLGGFALFGGVVFLN